MPAPQQPTTDCQSLTTTEVSRSVITAYIFHCCGGPSAWAFQTTDVCFEPSKDIYPAIRRLQTAGRQSTQHLWIIKSLWKHSKSTTAPADRHTIFTLSTPTSTIVSANYHSARTVKTSQPVQQAESAQISRLACIKSQQKESFQNNYSAACSSPKQIKAHCPTLTLPHIHNKNWVNE